MRHKAASALAASLVAVCLAIVICVCYLIIMRHGATKAETTIAKIYLREPYTKITQFGANTGSHQSGSQQDSIYLGPLSVDTTQSLVSGIEVSWTGGPFSDPFGDQIRVLRLSNGCSLYLRRYHRDGWIPTEAKQGLGEDQLAAVRGGTMQLVEIGVDCH